MADNAPIDAHNKGPNRETTVENVIWRYNDAVKCGYDPAPSAVAAEVTAIIREQVAREIEAEIETTGKGRSFIFGMGHAARIARGEL
jgi:hypothetical protein